MAGRCLLTFAVVIGAAVGLAGCGGDGSASVVARVGDTPVTKATLDQWMSAMATESAAATVSNRTLKQRALSFLISSQWLIGDAAEQGSAVSQREVERRLNEKVRAYPHGEAEFREVLKLTGRTVSDTLFDIEVELALAAVRRLAIKQQAKVTSAQVASYYDKHRQLFAKAEERRVALFYTKSDALVKRIKRAGALGQSLTSVAPYVESLVYTNGFKEGGNPVARAVHVAKFGMIEGPVRVGRNYFVFELKEVRPLIQSPLAQVASSIRQELEAEARQRALAAFIASWRRKWIARTDCQPGFVVQKCRQYIASKTSAPENPVAFE